MARGVELQQERRAFWRAIRDGVATVAAAERAGVSGHRGQRWFRECGGVSPVELAEPAGRYLSLTEREEIACALERQEGVREIARLLGRDKGAISRDGVYQRSWTVTPC